MYPELALGGIVLLFLLAEINFNQVGWSLLQQVHHVVQFAFLILGVILLIVGVGGRVYLPTMSRRELLLLTGLLVFALALRCVALDTAIPRYVDEVNFMQAVPRLWANPDTPILTPFGDLTAFTWVYPILQSGVSNILGSGLIGLRLISTVFGALGVVALYFLVRALFHDKWLAFVAALILATLPAHLHFSRLGLNNIADPFFGTLALAFLLRGLQSHHRSDYVLAGAALGLTQYFYEGGRLLFPLLFVVAFVVSWLLKGRHKADLVHAIYGLLVAVLIAAPVYYTLVGTGDSLTPRLRVESLKNNPWSPLFDSFPSAVIVLRERLLYPLLMYTSISDMSWFYGGTQAIVIMPFVPIFLLGVGYALRNLRSPAVIILFLWIVMTAIGNSFLRDSLWVPRYVVAFPAVAIFVAMGLYATLALLWPSSMSRRWFYGLLVGLSILVASAQTVFYFGDQVSQFDAQFQQEDWIDAFFHMINLPSGTHVHFIMDHPMWDENVAAFLAYHRLNLVVDSLTPDQVTSEYLQTIAGDKTIQHVFFLSPNKKDVLSRVQAYFTLAAPQAGTGITLKQYQLSLYKASALSE